jgi:3',5'-cyclic AMP phosphodiesterase CpdA
MFRILHLSDLHLRNDKKWSTIPILEEAKQLILEKADEENIDLVAITGDIANSGKAEEYDQALSWLSSLCLSSSGLNLQRDQLLLVPGNHDVDRSQIGPVASSIEDTLRNAATQEDVARIYQDEEAMAALLKRHAAYHAFTTNLLGSPRHTKNAYSSTFKARTGDRIRVDCLNTSWVCRGNDDHRRLLVGQPQLAELSTQSFDSTPSEVPNVRIVLMHHPLADLMEFDEENTSNFLKQQADIVLRGHLHKAGSSAIATNTGGFLELPGGALHTTHNAKNRFTILDISDDLTVLRVSSFVHADGRFILDRNLYDTIDGIGIFELPAKRGHAHAASQRSKGTPASFNLGPEATEESIQEVESTSSPDLLRHVPRFQRLPTAQDQVIRQK